FRAATFDKHNRDPLEGDQRPQLANESAERLVEVERRRERACAAVRSLEHVHPAPELVAERLGLARASFRERCLVRESLHEPTDDRARDQEDAEREGDAIPEKAWALVEVVHAPPLREDEVREQEQ